jgi:site-specific DNA-methyltransferase (adenine-specific)
MIAWVYGSGFLKSLDVSKAIDKAAGAEREKVRVKPRAETSGTMAGSSDTRPWIEKSRELGYHEVAGKEAVTEAARQWQGWGTALKPALEPITVARKPLIGTVAANVIAYGTGAINVDGCRVGIADWGSRPPRTPNAILGGGNGTNLTASEAPDGLGRWPANLIHDGGEFLGEQARFFYCAKASKRDRDEGCDALGIKAVHRYGAGIGEGIDPNAPAHNRNHHPTVKPTALMRYLCRLVTPPGGVVLDPFMGSGSTGKAAMLEGFQFIGIEREAEYLEIASARINAVQPNIL